LLCLVLDPGFSLFSLDPPVLTTLLVLPSLIILTVKLTGSSCPVTIFS